MRASSRRKAAAGVPARGSPAESSTVMPWRAHSAETRRARSRSGVTRATRALAAPARRAAAGRWPRPPRRRRRRPGGTGPQARPPALGRWLPPGRLRPWRAQGSGEQGRAGGRGAGDRRFRTPGAEILRLCPQRLQQPRLAGERMAGGGAKCVPQRLLRRFGAAGEDDGAIGQAGDHPQHFGRCRDGAAGADAGGDHRMRRRGASPRLGLGAQQRHAPFADIQQPLLRQPSAPIGGDRAQQRQGDLPVAGKLLRHQRVESVEIAAFQRRLVEKGGQRRGHAPGLVGGGGAAEAAWHLGEETG